MLSALSKGHKVSVTFSNEKDSLTLNFLKEIDNETEGNSQYFLVENQEGKKMFLKEPYDSSNTSAVKGWKLCCKLDHPNIVKGIQNNLEIVLYEYLENYKTLGEIMSILTKEQFLKILKQIITTMSYLYNNNIVHPDLHDGNIMVSEDLENVKIIDFDMDGECKNYSEKLTSCFIGFIVSGFMRNENQDKNFIKKVVRPINNTKGDPIQLLENCWIKQDEKEIEKIKEEAEDETKKNEEKEERKEERLVNIKAVKDDAFDSFCKEFIDENDYIYTNFLEKMRKYRSENKDGEYINIISEILEKYEINHRSKPIQYLLDIVQSCNSKKGKTAFAELIFAKSYEQFKTLWKIFGNYYEKVVKKLNEFIEHEEDYRDRAVHWKDLIVSSYEKLCEKEEDKDNFCRCDSQNSDVFCQIVSN